MITPDKMTNRITLHGLGFIQVQLEADQRLHVWHPELPRRRCFEHSAIHNHRFSFISQVLVGSQRNIEYGDVWKDDGEFVLYLHEGARTANGGRPWVPNGRTDMVALYDDVIPAGRAYRQEAYKYHRTEPQGNGKVATLIRKTFEGVNGSHSTCRFGVEPDTDFDRFQWSEQRLWEVVQHVLLGAQL
ncbi:hypothetical protein [Halopseudomonas salina]|uniref:Uncharacterized protein n=1 Tax=Halopseudomonas salina TaxID=1323744 RepID=A0ABQ1P0P2_9GAMM|nr:hypothetical protein [Halopseudomonas salina]GGC87117.1 hypothetical protein GCM10007418_03650 [Halopseudomonas salina]